MNHLFRKPWLAALAVGAVLCSAAAEEKTQKITFVQDDDQVVMVTRTYVLKHARAAEITPFVKSAIKRFHPDSKVDRFNDFVNNRQILIVSTGSKLMPFIDEMVEALDRPSKILNGSTVEGSGIYYGVYRPKYRFSEEMRDVVWDQVSNYEGCARVELDRKTGMFYFKDSLGTVEDIIEKLKWLDKPIPQVRIELKIYEVRDSDIMDLGIDYLGWKNGPGLNLFSVGYEALNLRVAEEILKTGADLMSNFTYGFGGFYTAPAFDFSFVRLLQQNGKATINSSATLTVTNNLPTASVNFSPEYQNVMKDKDHRSDVTIGGDATLTASILLPQITVGQKGVVNFHYTLKGSNVVERNNLGQEISEVTDIQSCSTLNYKQEKILTSWTKESEVEQTIGIPFLCELPVLKYIFGTTTRNKELTRYIVTARAIPVQFDENAHGGLIAEFAKNGK